MEVGDFNAIKGCPWPDFGRVNGTRTLDVWSRDLVVRVDFEGGGILGPGVADGLEGCSPSESLEVLGEVIGGDEGQEVVLQTLRWSTGGLDSRQFRQQLGTAR